MIGYIGTDSPLTRVTGTDRPAAANYRASASSRSERLSAGALSWAALKLERHDVAPASKSLPAGAKRHLVFISTRRGRVEVERDRKTISCDLSPGYVGVYPAGLPIHWSWPTRLSYSVLALDPQFLDHVARRTYGADPGDFELLPAERKHDLDIATLVGTLMREAARAGPDSALYVESLASILAAHLLRHYSTWTRGGPSYARVQGGLRFADHGTGLPEAVQRAVRYIHEHHARGIDLREIAEAASLSPYHLTRLFRHSLGTPPHRYLIQVRVQSAHAMLRIGASRLSLAEVAAACGFSDQSHLNRHFKRLLGVTPGQLTRPIPNHRPGGRG